MTEGMEPIPALCARLGIELEDGAVDVAICDASRLVDCDAGTIDGLARLALELRRTGRRLVLRGAPPELIELLDLVGLRDAVPQARPDAGDASVEVRREPEQREEALRVEEEGDAGDPVA